jgi:hypothetical protein
MLKVALARMCRIYLVVTKTEVLKLIQETIEFHLEGLRE